MKVLIFCPKCGEWVPGESWRLKRVIHEEVPICINFVEFGTELEAATDEAKADFDTVDWMLTHDKCKVGGYNEEDISTWLIIAGGDIYLGGCKVESQEDIERLLKEISVGSEEELKRIEGEAKRVYCLLQALQK